MCLITDTNDGLVKTLEKDKQFLMSELGKMKARYADLHGQIDQMTKLMTEKQVNFISKALSVLYKTSCNPCFARIMVIEMKFCGIVTTKRQEKLTTTFFHVLVPGCVHMGKNQVPYKQNHAGQMRT